MWSRPWPLAQALAQAAGDWDLPSPRGRVPGGVPAWGQPGNAARAFLEELVGKIRSDVSLWARGMESLGPFWWLSSLGEGTARLAVAVGPRGAQHHLGCGE